MTRIHRQTARANAGPLRSPERSLGRALCARRPPPQRESRIRGRFGGGDERGDLYRELPPRWPKIAHRVEPVLRKPKEQPVRGPRQTSRRRALLEVVERKARMPQRRVQELRREALGFIAARFDLERARRSLQLPARILHQQVVVERRRTARRQSGEETAPCARATNDRHRRRSYLGERTATRRCCADFESPRCTHPARRNRGGRSAKTAARESSGDP